MSRALLICSCILALGMIAVYRVRCFKLKEPFDYEVMIGTIFQASGLVGGFALVTSVFVEEMKQYLVGLDLYVFVGGLSVFAVSVHGFYKGALQGLRRGAPE